MMIYRASHSSLSFSLDSPYSRWVTNDCIYRKLIEKLRDIEATLLLQSFPLPFLSSFQPFRNFYYYPALQMRSSRVPVSHRAMIDPEIFWKKKEISSKLLWNKSEGNNFRKYFKGVAWKKKENKSKIVRSLRFRVLFTLSSLSSLLVVTHKIVACVASCNCAARAI